MNHDVGCADPTVIVQPQIARGLPVIAQCTTCGAVEARTPTRHMPGEVCRTGGACCDPSPDGTTRAWKPPQPRRRNAPAVFRPTAPQNTTTTNEDPDATSI